MAEEAQPQGLLCSPETRDRPQTDTVGDRRPREGDRRGTPGRPREPGLQHPLPSTTGGGRRAVAPSSRALVLAQAVLYPRLSLVPCDFPHLLGMHSHTAAAEQIPNNNNPFALEGKAW